MKNRLIGFLLIGLTFSTVVSFASNGPETTKDCVIDNLDVVEAPIVVGEFVISAANVVVFDNVKNIPSIITMIAFNGTLKQVTLFCEDYVDSLFNVHYGLPSIHLSYSNEETRTKTNNLAYKFVNKNCLTRQLIRC